MKALKIAVLVLVLAAAGVALAKDKSVLLWGAQKAQRVTGIWQSDGNTIDLTRKARIAEVDTDAPSYCIWSQGTAVLCGSDDFSPVGQILEPGRYTVYPRLRRAQTQARVEIRLDYIE